MAAMQLMDYLENGNIKKLRQFPGVRPDRSDKVRLTISNKNGAPALIERITHFMADHKINIAA